MPITLTTDRLILRSARESDLEELCRLNGDPEVMRYVGAGNPQDAAQTATSFQRYRQMEADHPGYGVWVAVERNSHQFIGLFFLVPYAQTGEVEVGYRLLQEHWGCGFATEGARVVIEHGFQALRLKRIIAIAYPQNSASIRVLEKCGMRREGMLMDQKLGLEVVYCGIEAQGGPSAAQLNR